MGNALIHSIWYLLFNVIRKICLIHHFKFIKSGLTKDSYLYWMVYLSSQVSITSFHLIAIDWKKSWPNGQLFATNCFSKWVFFGKKQYPRPCRKEKIEPKYLYILSVVTITHIHTNTTKAFCLLRCKQNISRKNRPIKMAI